MQKPKAIRITVRKYKFIDAKKGPQRDNTTDIIIPETICFLKEVRNRFIFKSGSFFLICITSNMLMIILANVVPKAMPETPILFTKIMLNSTLNITPITLLSIGVFVS